MAWREPSASELRDRVTVERNTPVEDDTGSSEAVWSPIVTSSAAKIDLVRGGEEVRAKRLSGVGQFDITLRASPATLSITPADRLTDDRTGDRFNIKWAGSFDTQKRFVVLTCEQGGLHDG